MLSTVLFAQNIYEPFKVGNEFILADTNGNIPIAERFDYVQDMISHNSEYIVRVQGKYGVVMNGKYVFTCEYDRIVPVYLFRFHTFALEKNGKKALGTIDGMVHSGFDYEDIRKYSTTENPPYFEPDYDGIFLIAEKGTQFQLFYTIASGKTVSLTKNPVDNIQDWKKFFVFRKGKQEAMYKFDTQTLTLKEIIPFANHYIQFDKDTYMVLDQTAKTAKIYTYEHVLIETRENVSIPVTLPKNYRLKKEQEGPEPASGKSVPKTVDLVKDREILMSGKQINVHRGFDKRYPLHTAYTTKFYLAEMTITGNKGSWEVKSHFIQDPGPEKQNDVVFQVEADELIRKTDLMSRFLVTKKGNLYGAVDSRGNEILPAKYANPEYIRSKYDEEWLILREANELILLSYNPYKKGFDRVYYGNVDDELDIYGAFIRVKRHISKKSTQMKLVKMKDVALSKQAEVIDNNAFFDSIAYSVSFPGFFPVFKDGKAGMLSNETTLIIPCAYDSVQVNAYYLTQVKYGMPRYICLQPIFSAYRDGKQQIFRPTVPKDDDFEEVSSQLIPSFENGTLNAAASISDDGLYVIDELGNNLVDVYAITGKKLTKEPVVLNPDNRKMASFADSIKGYWFLRGTDQQNQEILVGQNGAWFVLPVKN